MSLRSESSRNISQVVRSITSVCAIALLSLPTPMSAQQKVSGPPKLAKPQQLDKDIEYVRDPETGELRAVPKRSAPSASNAPSGAARGGFAIRSRVNLVEVSCSAIPVAGEPLRNFTREDFQLSADGVPHPL